MGRREWGLAPITLFRGSTKEGLRLAILTAKLCGRVDRRGIE
ncbi:hypothetical protein BVI2075_960002 [Burkholderia vietnamiensis]|nr:hypothetical protein BVI2075_960002 [Burkholderia vietnamiensis]